MIVPNFLFNQKATVRPYIKRDMTGDVYGTQYTIMCRYEPCNQKITSRSAGSNSIQEVISTGRAYFPAGTRFPENSEVTIDGDTHRALSIKPEIAFVENHVKVMLV